MFYPIASLRSESASDVIRPRCQASACFSPHTTSVRSPFFVLTRANFSFASCELRGANSVTFAFYSYSGGGSYIVAGVLALAATRIFFRTKRDDADFMYLKEEGKKEALAAKAKNM